MNNASQETKQFYEVEEDGNYIILVFQLTGHGDEASMGGTHNQKEAFNAPIPVFLLLNWLPILQLVTSMMDPEQFYLFWKILVLTLESILPQPVRRLILTGFGTRAKRALTHPKSAAEKLDSRKRGIIIPRKQKRNLSMRLVLSNWEHELWFKFNI